MRIDICIEVEHGIRLRCAKRTPLTCAWDPVATLDFSLSSELAQRTAGALFLSDFGSLATASLFRAIDSADASWSRALRRTKRGSDEAPSIESFNPPLMLAYWRWRKPPMDGEQKRNLSKEMRRIVQCVERRITREAILRRHLNQIGIRGENARYWLWDGDGETWEEVCEQYSV